MTVFLIKLVHTLIFAVMSACVLYLLYSGLANRITKLTHLAAFAVLAEGAALLANDWRCPLTTLAEQQGAHDGSVAKLFLPAWFAPHLFPVCGALFGIGLVAVVFRIARQRRRTANE